MKKQLKHIVFAITIVWNFFHDSCHAQTSQIDSLKISLSQAKNDSLKCQTLGELGASYYYHVNLSEALSSYENALSLSKTLHYKQGIANSYSGIGMVQEAQGNYEEAIQNMYASLKIMEELGDQHHIVSTYVNMALVLADHGDFEQALKTQIWQLKFLKNLEIVCIWVMLTIH
ncbi:MAG: tetratricopeptide repeat protein [Bacteroidetes bacterium]|nr:tetratricopeptide repeat protein [Bacteroidota bacterium]